ncbi:15310_t:CDS:1, partial [Funneliformis caledonium]
MFMKNEELLKELKKKILKGEIEIKGNSLVSGEHKLNLTKLVKLNELKEKRSKIITKQLELFKEYQEENEQSEGYMNCPKDACMY